MVGLSLGFYSISILMQFLKRKKKKVRGTRKETTWQHTPKVFFYGVINKETSDVNPNGESAICQHIWTIDLPLY